jgi:hypothetical protein
MRVANRLGGIGAYQHVRDPVDSEHSGADMPPDEQDWKPFHPQGHDNSGDYVRQKHVLEMRRTGIADEKQTAKRPPHAGH